MDEDNFKKNSVSSLFYVYKDENICGIVIIKRIPKQADIDYHAVNKMLAYRQMTPDEFNLEYFSEIFFYSEITNDYQIDNKKNGLINDFILLSVHYNAVFDFIKNAKTETNNKFIFGFYKDLNIFLTELIKKKFVFSDDYYKEMYEKFKEEIEEIEKIEKYNREVRGAQQEHMGSYPI